MTKVRRISVVLITIGLWSCDDPSERSSAADIQSMTSSPTDVAGISAQLAAGRPSGLGNVTSLGGRLANGSPSAGGLQRPVAEPPSAGRQVVIAGQPSTGGRHGVTGRPLRTGWPERWSASVAGQSWVDGDEPEGRCRAEVNLLLGAEHPLVDGHTPEGMSVGGHPNSGGQVTIAGHPLAGGERFPGGQSALGRNRHVTLRRSSRRDRHCCRSIGVSHDDTEIGAGAGQHCLRKWSIGDPRRAWS